MFRHTELSDSDLNQLFNLSPNPYVILDREWRLIGMNDAYLSVTGRLREEITGVSMFEAFPSDPDSPHGRLLRQSLAKVFETGDIDHISLITYPIPGPDGTFIERYWSATHTPIKDRDGGVAFVLQHTVDVTELQILRNRASGDASLMMQTDLLRRADAVQGENLVLGAEREFLRHLFEQAPGFMAVVRGPDHVFSIVNEAYRALVGRDDLIGRHVHEALPDVAGQGFFELLDEVYRSGRPHSAQAARIMLQPPGQELAREHFLDFVFQPIRDGDGHVNGIFVQGHDVTALRQAQAAAQANEARFRTLAQSLPNHVWTATPDGRMEWSNDQIIAYGDGEFFFDRSRRSDIIHPDDAPLMSDAWQAALASGKRMDIEIRLRRHDGVYRWFICRAVPIEDAEGAITLWIGTNTDIDDQKRTQAELTRLAEALNDRVEERTIELERTQAVLRQAQKTEAIGNLAGGIAHDFNNLLQVITGNLQLLARDVAGNPLASKRLENALAGAARGARLASQLLSFGRRQPLSPKVINLGRLVREMDHLLRRSLGEAIEIDTIVGGGLWNTLADPGNVENALLNLAINARDAMDGRGKLTIELGNAFLDDEYARGTFDVKPGQYVLLAVSDTGSGMTAEVLEKVFDPFFTTKPEGKGTGLGLSMVHGFVKQSGGHIRIYSEPGSGTTVRIYLPRSMEQEDMIAESRGGEPVGGSETVLVVEDDEAVRDTTVALLAELGYKVLRARDADGGLAVVESGAAIDVLFTDVVMPGRLKSSELARKARERLPNLAVLFTSGYTENSIVHGGRLDPGVNLLSKPFTREALARKIRQVIEDSRKDGAVLMTPPQLSSPAPVLTTLQPQIEARSITVLLVEDEALIRIATADFLQDLGMTVLEAGTSTEALKKIAGQKIDILVTDIHLPEGSGADLVRNIRAALPQLPVIFATGDPEVPGLDDLPLSALIAKPYDYDHLAARIRAMVMT